MSELCEDFFTSYIDFLKKPKPEEERYVRAVLVSNNGTWGGNGKQEPTFAVGRLNFVPETTVLGSRVEGEVSYYFDLNKDPIGIGKVQTGWKLTIVTSPSVILPGQPAIPVGRATLQKGRKKIVIDCECGGGLLHGIAQETGYGSLTSTMFVISLSKHKLDLSGPN